MNHLTPQSAFQHSASKWLELLNDRLLPDYDLGNAMNYEYGLPTYSDVDFNSLKPAAVLVPLIWRDGDVNVILTMRTGNLKNHAGQIAFPGGRKDPEDNDLRDTALREAYEEIGLDCNLVEIIGSSDCYQTNTGYLVRPIIGIVNPNATFVINADEVDEIFEIPLSFLLNRKNQKEVDYEMNGEKRNYLAIPYKGYYVWGVTAAMIRMLEMRLFDEGANDKYCQK